MINNDVEYEECRLLYEALPMDLKRTFENFAKAYHRSGRPYPQWRKEVQYLCERANRELEAINNIQAELSVPGIVKPKQRKRKPC